MRKKFDSKMTKNKFKQVERQDLLGGSFDDCPYCDWEYLGFESKLNEEEYEEVNRTIKQAKENFAKGLDIWGDPLPKKK